MAPQRGERDHRPENRGAAPPPAGRHDHQNRGGAARFGSRLPDVEAVHPGDHGLQARAD